MYEKQIQDFNVLKLIRREIFPDLGFNDVAVVVSMATRSQNAQELVEKALFSHRMVHVMRHLQVLDIQALETYICRFFSGFIL